MEQSAAARSEYVIRGGHEGRRRLELLSRVMWPSTYRLLKSAGARKGMTILDLGCGGGDVTLGLARIAGAAGRVVGIDMDPVKLERAHDAAAFHNLHHVEFRQGNVYAWSELELYDRIYTRFLLTHLPDSTAALARIRQALKPGGVLIVEDIDFSGSFCYPPCEAYNRYVELYREVVRRRNGDADIGPKLHRLLADAGFQGVQLGVIHPVHVNQEGKDLSLSTLINIADAVLAESLAQVDELAWTISKLEEFTNDPTTVISLPRVFQAVGSRA
jgi:SAM-dependent methyltransferase